MAASPRRFAPQAQALGVPREQCFPLETLAPDLRARAEALLLQALDGEALYTLVGGVKPMSSGWLSHSFDLDNPDAAKLDELRQIVATFRVGNEIEAHLHAFARPFKRKIMLEATLFCRPTLRAMIGEKQQFWNGFGITPAADPLETLLVTEYGLPAQRFRGYGYLFGYPQHAVDFFVEASQKQDADPQKKLVQRDFLSIPTFKSDTNRFVYAVPKGQAPNAADEALRQKCAPILAQYRRRRALFIGEGKPGVVALLRDWFHNGAGRYSPTFARF